MYIDKVEINANGVELKKDGTKKLNYLGVN